MSMSVVEKLQVLREAPYNTALAHSLGMDREETGQDQSVDAIATILGVLPKILVVLREAEQLAACDDYHSWGERPGDSAFPELAAALADLEKAID